MMDEKTIKSLVRDCLQDKIESEGLTYGPDIKDVISSYCTSILQAVQKAGLDLETLGTFHACTLANLVCREVFFVFRFGYGKYCWDKDEAMTKFFEDGFREGYTKAKADIEDYVLTMDDLYTIDFDHEY